MISKLRINTFGGSSTGPLLEKAIQSEIEISDDEIGYISEEETDKTKTKQTASAIK